MEKLLLSGTNLIVDRYAFSGVAFSASKPVCFYFDTMFHKYSVFSLQTEYGSPLVQAI